MELVTQTLRDPTRTMMLRKEYADAARRRFRALKALLNTSIIDNDALLLSDRRNAASLRSEADIILHLLNTNVIEIGDLVRNIDAAKRYDFPSDAAGKFEAFMNWLYQAMDDGILEVILRDSRRIVAHNAWQNVYVRAAYSRGIDQASAAMRAAGMEIPAYSIAAVLNYPMHADVLGLLFARNFDELKGITEAMGQQIARALVEGLSQGLGPRQVAQMIAERVDAIGITRATTLARTEIIRAHAEATLNRYQEFGLQGVMGLAEWVTAGDDRVCELCADLDGKEMSIQDARGLLPRHPNCRCSWLPTIRLRANVRRKSRL